MLRKYEEETTTTIYYTYESLQHMNSLRFDNDDIYMFIYEFIYNYVQRLTYDFNHESSTSYNVEQGCCDGGPTT